MATRNAGRDLADLVEAMPEPDVDTDDLRQMVDKPTPEEYRYTKDLTVEERLRRAMELNRFVERWRTGMHG